MGIAYWFLALQQCFIRRNSWSPEIFNIANALFKGIVPFYLCSEIYAMMALLGGCYGSHLTTTKIITMS